MIQAGKASAYERCTLPWIHEKIEVWGRTMEGEPISFCLIGAWHCDFPSGPDLRKLAYLSAKITGETGFFGLKASSL